MMRREMTRRTLSGTGLAALLAAGLALGPPGCAGDSDGGDDPSSTQGRLGGDPGSGEKTEPGPNAAGSCEDLLDDGACEGTSGEKLEACKTSLEAAYQDCRRFEACSAERAIKEKTCGDKPEPGTSAWTAFEACLVDVDAAFTECLGADGTSPGTP